MESVGQPRVGHHNRPLRRVPQNRAPIRIEMIVALASVVMLVIRLCLLFGRARVAALAVSMCWSQKGNGNDGKQNARRTHGSSPSPGDSIGVNPNAIHAAWLTLAPNCYSQKLDSREHRASRVRHASLRAAEGAAATCSRVTSES